MASFYVLNVGLYFERAMTVSRQGTPVSMS